MPAISGVANSPVANSGTLVINYPNGVSNLSGVATASFVVVADNDVYAVGSGVSVVFNSTSLTVTNSTGVTWPALATVRVQYSVPATTTPVTVNDITTAWSGPSYPSTMARRKASAGSANIEADFDSSGNLIRTFDATSGRIDMWGVGAAGSACVVAYAANPGVDGNVLGHFAFRGYDTNGQSNTYGWTLCTQTTASAAGANSNLQFSVMSGQATSGNTQPNWAMTLRGAQKQLRFDSGAAIYTASQSLSLGGGDTTGLTLSSTKVQSNLPVQLAQELVTNNTTATITLTAADAGAVFTNATAAAQVQYTLPSGLSSGNRFRFTNLSPTQALKIVCPTGTTIRAAGATASSDGGFITSSQQFASVELMYSATTTTWVAVGFTGTGGTANFGGWTVG